MGVMETYAMSAGGGWKGETREWILVKGKTKKNYCRVDHNNCFYFRRTLRISGLLMMC